MILCSFNIWTQICHIINVALLQTKKNTTCPSMHFWSVHQACNSVVHCRMHMCPSYVFALIRVTHIHPVDDYCVHWMYGVLMNFKFTCKVNASHLCEVVVILKELHIGDQLLTFHHFLSFWTILSYFQQILYFSVSILTLWGPYGVAVTLWTPWVHFGP